MRRRVSNEEMGALMVGLFIVAGSALCYDMAHDCDEDESPGRQTPPAVQADGADAGAPNPKDRCGLPNTTEDDR